MKSGFEITCNKCGSKTNIDFKYFERKEKIILKLQSGLEEYSISEFSLTCSNCKNEIYFDM